MAQMAERRRHEVRRDRCEVAESIRLPHGIAPAFDHAVGETLPTFADTAEDRHEFARPLPPRVSKIGRMFTPEEVEEYLARIERARSQQAMDAMNACDPEPADLAALACAAWRFEFVKEPLAAPAPGAS